MQGFFVGVENERKDKELGFYIFLKQDDGSLIKLKDTKPFEFNFWVESFQNIRDLLSKESFRNLTLDDLAISSVTKYHDGRRKQLTQITVKKPYHRSEVTNVLKRYQKRTGGIRRIIGAERSLRHDYELQHGIKPFRFLVEDCGAIRTEEREFKPRTAVFDMEVYNKDEKGETYFPKPENGAKSPIILITYASDSRTVGLTHTHTPTNIRIASLPEEADTISRFLELPAEDKIDFIYSWNGDKYDWAYLVMRAKQCGIKIELNGRQIRRVKGGIAYIYDVPGIQEIDLMQEFRKISEPVPGAGLKETSEAVLFRAPKRIKGKEIHEYWDNDKLRPQLFEYGLEDVLNPKAIIDNYGIAEAEVMASQLFGLWPKQLGRKTGDEIFFNFVQYMHKDDVALDEPKFAKRDFVNERDKFCPRFKCGLHRAGLFDLSLLHANTLLSTLEERIKECRDFRIDHGHFSMIAESVRMLMDEYSNAVKKFEDTKNEKFNTFANYLSYVLKYAPSVILSGKYWRDEKLSAKYVENLNNAIAGLGDGVLYADWDRAFVDVREIHLAEYTLFKNGLKYAHRLAPVVPVLIIGKKSYVYLNQSNNLLYPKGVTVKRRTESDWLNDSVEAFYRSVLNGVNANKFLENLGAELRNGTLTKEKFLRSGMLSKPEKEYSTGNDASKAAFMMFEAEVNKHFEYGEYFTGPDEKTYVKPDDYVPNPQSATYNFITKTRKALDALGISRNAATSIMGKGDYHQIEISQLKQQSQKTLGDYLF